MRCSNTYRGSRERERPRREPRIARASLQPARARGRPTVTPTCSAFNSNCMIARRVRPQRRTRAACGDPDLFFRPPLRRLERKTGLRAERTAGGSIERILRLRSQGHATGRSVTSSHVNGTDAIGRKSAATPAQSAMPIEGESDGAGRSHSCSFDQRRRPETLCTAMAMAFFCPTRTTSRLPRVTPV